MPAWLAAAAPYIASAVGGLASSALNNSGARDVNRQAYQRSLEQMAFDRQTAKMQMDFQERMSNTAYQRAATDLDAAGLNRILALGSPASTPGGAGISAPNLGAQTAQALAPLGQQGTTLMTTAANTGQAVANIQQTMATAAKTKEETKILGPQAKIYDKASDLIDSLLGSIEDGVGSWERFGNEHNSAVDQTLKDLEAKIDKYRGSAEGLIKMVQDSLSSVLPGLFK